MLMLFALLLGGPAIPAAMDATDVPDYHVLSPYMAAAGQPTSKGWPRLKDKGFRVVIDLRPDGQELPDERRFVEHQGLHYLRFPIAAETFVGREAMILRQLIDLYGSGPVLVHSSSADSAGGVWAVLQAAAGKSPEEALQEGRRGGLKSEEMIAAVRRALEDPAGMTLPSTVVRDYDKPPRMLKNMMPRYPWGAFHGKIEGVVELDILIDATGRVAQARVTKSIPLLDVAALECVYRWRFSPAFKSGLPVATEAKAPVTFRITDKKPDTAAARQ